MMINCKKTVNINLLRSTSAAIKKQDLSWIKMELVSIFDYPGLIVNFKSYIVNTVKKTNDRNQENYSFFLDRDFHFQNNYLDFTLLLDSNGQIVSFQGIRFDRYPTGVVRVADRHFLDPHRRLKSMGERSPFYLRYVLDHDVERCKSLGQSLLFISVQGSYGPAVLKTMIRYANGKGYKFKTDDMYYNTGSDKSSRNQNSWQSCMWLHLDNQWDSLPLPRIKYDQWRELNCSK
jgi:hypothetical protein